MYENLVKSLREEAEPCERSGCVQTANEMRQAADAIEELKKEVLEWQKCRDLERSLRMALEMKMPHWIPVTERLPEERISELTDDFSYYPCIYQAYDGKREVRYYQYGKGRFNKGHFWHGAQIMDDSIIAWAEPMPLPEPPEEDKP